MEQIKWVRNQMPPTQEEALQVMALNEMDKVHTFHKSFPMYEVTPLQALCRLADFYHLGGIFVKDESYRFGLNAFKVLGGSLAMGKHIAKTLGKDLSELDYDTFISTETKKQLGDATFFTATDGNHGRGVAWAANKLGQKAVVFMPKGSQTIRLQNIQKEGATATIETVNYDECVRLATAAACQTPGGVVVQDTAWEGYTEIPSWIMQGYGTMVKEALEQLGQKPTHVFVQAGVGSLAGAVIGYIANHFVEGGIQMVVVEASEAACLYNSAVAGDGRIRIVTGDMPTIMAGLACGEPNTISWEILKNHTHYFVSCPDWVAAKGMCILGAPLKGDPRVISGESGAVTLGFLASVMEEETLKPLKEHLGLNEESIVLLFSTEGDTDPEHYRQIVWQHHFKEE
ncbi:MAG: diaminopropionate ammonia-lyase [Niameybacter sp.]|uniref:diaminopropionate ammonia-lyase n=1 Tax=Niameybacter sp. TaxID=2033640 RepID=UPI002FC7E081